MSCSIEDCELPKKARGWCRSHYERWKRWGDPLAGRPVFATIEERFLSHVIASEDGCWRWVSSRTHDGYGTFQIGARESVLAHRWSYTHWKGEISAGYHVDHLCRVRECVRPGHLEAVTPKENKRRSDLATGLGQCQTYCVNGHEFTEANTYVGQRGGRGCRACNAVHVAAYKSRLKGRT